MRIYEILKEDAEDRPHLSKDQLDAVERFADKLWEKLGIDVKFGSHFLERLYRRENDPPISGTELVRLFKQEYQKYGKEIASLPPETEGVFMDLLTNVNLPFVIKQRDEDEPKKILGQTIMRKPSNTVKGEFVPKGKPYKIGRTD